MQPPSPQLIPRHPPSRRRRHPARRSRPRPRPPPPTGTKVDCRKVKCVALTFDDGPAPTTQKLLRYLADKRVEGSLFILGQQVETYPKLAKAVAGAGNEIGVHTWDHRDLTKLSPQQIDREITSTIGF